MLVSEALLLGIVEGVTEFLPISSTGHLILVSSWLGLDQTQNNYAFEIIIQIAAILAVIANYFEKLSFRFYQLWLKVAIAFLPIACMGLLLHDSIKALFTPQIVAVMFIVGGVVFILIEKKLPPDNNPTRDLSSITYKQSILIGLAQVFAIIPGTSRAGASIVGALLAGLNRKTATEFSFLLALPVIGAASGLELLKNYQAFDSASWTALLVGFATTFITAYIVMKGLLALLSKFSFIPFGIYRIIFGVLLLIALI